MSRTTSRGVALLVLIFAVGMLAGVAVEKSLANRASGDTRIKLRAPDLLDRLGLTSEQRRTADSILAQNNPRSEAIMRDMVPRLAAIADSVNLELSSILTPSQRLKLDSLTRGAVFLLRKKDSTGKERIDTVRKR